MDENVLQLQMKLNAVRGNIHGMWPYLKPDGLMGPQTRLAIDGFKKYRGIPSTDKNWISKLDIEYQRVPMLRAATPSSNSVKKKTPYEIYEFIADKIIKNIADTLSDISDQVCKEVKKIKSKGTVSPNEIKQIVNSMIDRPNVRAMKELIEKNVWEEIEKIAHGNTNKINYKHDAKTIYELEKIKQANRQLQTRMLSNQSKSVINKSLGQQVLDKCVKELESANFKRIITEKVEKTVKIPKAGGMLTALSFLPLSTHICELIYTAYQGKPVKDVVSKVVADLISILVGFVLTLVIASLVAAVGITGGLAVVVVVALGIIVCLLLSFFFPDWETQMADKLVNSIYNVIQSMKIYQRDSWYYQYTYPTPPMI